MENIQFIGTTPAMLQKLLYKDFEKLIINLEKNFQPKKPTEYLTRSEVAEMLSINLSTVHNWVKRDIIQSYGIGARVYFKREEIEEAIVKLNKK